MTSWIPDALGDTFAAIQFQSHISTGFYALVNDNSDFWPSTSDPRLGIQLMPLSKTGKSG